MGGCALVSRLKNKIDTTTKNSPDPTISGPHKEI